MSSIVWDEYHINHIMSYLEDRLALVQGRITVEADDAPPSSFLVQIDLDHKVLKLYNNPELPLMDLTINLILSYIIMLAYDSEDWDATTPSAEILLDFHDQVCNIISNINEDVSEMVRSYQVIITRWREAHINNTRKKAGLEPLQEPSGPIIAREIELKPTTPLPSFSSGLFGAPKDDKWSIN